MEDLFLQEMRKDENFGWLYVWDPTDTKDRPRFFGTYDHPDQMDPSKFQPGVPDEYVGGVLKTVYRGSKSRLQIYEVTGPIISKLPRLLHIYESTFGAI